MREEIYHSEKAEALVTYLEACGFENVGVVGKDILASCPFAKTHHSSGEDRHPSWGMLVETGQWHCFSCHQKGNLYTLSSSLGVPLFDMKNLPKMPYSEMMNRLKAKFEHWRTDKEFGVPIEALPREYLPFDFERDTDNKALVWLRDKGYSDDTLRFFGIGYNRETGNPVFPIPDDDGRVVGAQERNLNRPRAGPKYLNTNLPKGRYWYNYYYTKKEPEVVVVEAFLSVLTLHEIGLAAISPGGAWLTETQAGKLGVFNTVTFCFDNDPAGMLGIKRVSELCSGILSRIYFVTMPRSTKVHRMKREEILSVLKKRRLLLLQKK